MDEYYSLARRLKELDRQSLAREIQKLQRQTADQVVETVLNILGQAEHEGWNCAKTRELVSSIEIRGARLATDRDHLKRCEAILAALRKRRALLVSKREIATAFAAGDGVDVGSANETTIEVALHPRKFAGE